MNWSLKSILEFNCLIWLIKLIRLIDWLLSFLIQLQLIHFMKSFKRTPTRSNPFWNSLYLSLCGNLHFSSSFFILNLNSILAFWFQTISKVWNCWKFRKQTENWMIERIAKSVNESAGKLRRNERLVKTEAAINLKLRIEFISFRHGSISQSSEFHSSVSFILLSVFWSFIELIAQAALIQFHFTLSEIDFNSNFDWNQLKKRWNEIRK